MIAKTRTIVELQGVWRCFAGRQHPLFRNLHLQISAGEVVAIVGRSGCGKSTLLNLVSTLDRPERGVVKVHGAPLIRHPASNLKVGYLFQQPALLPWASVLSNALLGVRCNGGVHDEDRDRARAMLAAFGLEGRDGDRPHRLSGGECQRVALAQSLLVEPDLLLLDEPFSSLDVPTRLGLERVVLDVTRQNTARGHARATVIVTHDLEEAVVLADRVLVLGRIAGGTPSAVIGEMTVVGLEDRDPVGSRRSPVVAAYVDQIMALLASERRGDEP